MAKTALVAGISDYPKPPDLEAAVPEAERWADLLTKSFGFTPPILWRDSQVTLAAVTNELERLLDNASAADQIVFVYCGHGDIVTVSPTVGQEALLLYDQPFTETRFATLVKNHYRLGTFTVVLESCFSGGFEPMAFVKGLQTLAGMFGFGVTKYASPPHPRGSQESFEVVFRFGDMSLVPAEQKRPLIVAACGPNELAAQAPYAPLLPRHMRFSREAIPYLKQTPSASHAKFRTDVTPKVFGQKVTMKGDLGRLPNPFFT